MSEKSALKPAAGNPDIVIKGVRVHNLKNLDLKLPRRSLVVITGPSGSGKSSLAFDTLYAEGQRRYIESLSSYAHQFLDQLAKPDVDRIEGLSPALAIEQKGLGSSPRSTVGTVTEIFSFLRLLYARCGTVHCPDCHVPVGGRSLADIRDEIASLPEGTRFHLLAPVVRGRKGEHRQLLDDLRSQGFLRAVVDGELVELDGDVRLQRHNVHDIAVVVDGMKARPDLGGRLRESLERAAEVGQGTVIVRTSAGETRYSRGAACPGCGRGFAVPEPRLFSFNSPAGSCPECNGLGHLRSIEAEYLVPDTALSIKAGAVEFLKGKESSWIYVQVEALAGAMGFDLNTPFGELSESARTALLLGFSSDLRKELAQHPHFNAFLDRKSVV